jgi:PBSX family phage terminase large subunit
MDLDRITRVMSPRQIRSVVESSHHRVSIWHGAVRSGKTIASLLAFLLALSTAPDSGLVIVCGRTLQTIERNLIEPLQDRALFGVIADQVHHTAGATTAVVLGRTVHLIGANDARAEGKLRGLTACLAYVDEATLIPEPFWTQLLARLSVPGARLLATTNPDGPAHWLRRDWLLRADELRLGAWRFGLDDNPALSQNYVDALRREYVGLWYRRMIDGAWCLAEGAIYDAWDPDRHVVDDLPHMERWYGVGIDYGTRNPFAALLLGHGADNRLYFVSEYRYDSRQARRQLADVEYSRRLRDWIAGVPIPRRTDTGPKPDWWIVDPSAASMARQLHDDGIATHPGDNSVNDGIRLVSSLLARDRLRVHRSCAGWINEIPGYSWDPRAAERGEDRPIKVDDHSLDAGRYVIRTTAHMWRARLGLGA